MITMSCLTLIALPYLDCLVVPAVAPREHYCLSHNYFASLTVRGKPVFLFFPKGIHHYYLRNWGWGVAYTFTGGLFGIGWLVDAFRLPSLVRSTNKRLEEERMNAMPPVVSLCNAYAFGATPLGIFGAHHFYMGRKGFGMFYLMTLGLCGFGWIVDWFRMKWLVHRTNHPEEKVLGKRCGINIEFNLAEFKL